MAATVAELNIEEQDALAERLKEFWKDLESLSQPPEPLGIVVALHNLVRENDELMQLGVTNAFKKSAWNSIIVQVVDHESRYVGDKTTLFNAIFRGMEHNTFVEFLTVEALYNDETEQQLPFALPCLLPPNLKVLRLTSFDFREEVAFIQCHQNLKELSLDDCNFCPRALSKSISCHGSLQYLGLIHRVPALKEFFDSVSSCALQELQLQIFGSENALGIAGIEAMHRALEDKRMTFGKLRLLNCIDKKDVHALTAMLAHDTTIKELAVTSYGNLGEYELQKIISSLEDNTGLQALELAGFHGATLESAELIKDFVRKRRDGTLEQVSVYMLYSLDARHATQEEIDVLLAMNKLKPLVSADKVVPHSEQLSILQHERFSCVYFFLREKLDVILSCVEEPAEVEESTTPKAAPKDMQS